MLENRSNTTASEAVDLSASRDGLGPIYKRYVLAISRLNSHLKLLKYDPSSDAQVCAPFFVRGVSRFSCAFLARSAARRTARMLACVPLGST